MDLTPPPISYLGQCGMAEKMWVLEHQISLGPSPSSASYQLIQVDLQHEDNNSYLEGLSELFFYQTLPQHPLCVKHYSEHVVTHFILPTTLRGRC